MFSFQTGSVTLKTTKAKPTSHKYVIDFDLRDLKSLKRSRPNLGWSYIIFILKDGTTYPALHFHRGGTKAFVKELEAFLLIKKLVFVVMSSDPSSLTLRPNIGLHFGLIGLPQTPACTWFGNKIPRHFQSPLMSFSCLKSRLDMCFQWVDSSVSFLIWIPIRLPCGSCIIPTALFQKFINDPVTATMGGFSKVTNFLYDALLVPPESSHRPAKDVADILSEDIPGIKVNSQEETGFEMVTTVSILSLECKHWAPSSVFTVLGFALAERAAPSARGHQRCTVVSPMLGSTHGQRWPNQGCWGFEEDHFQRGKGCNMLHTSVNKIALH